MQVLLKLDISIKLAKIKQKKAQSCVVRTDDQLTKCYNCRSRLAEDNLVLVVKNEFWLAIVKHQSATRIVTSNQPAFLNGAAIAKTSTISSRC
ncbi:hypothetical protein T10_8520 [Trichinella papuae]|uniref:Uncharacterized protein n=1 Tax=Trichinella papuae TaxID=268474 RepID=A0A0V1MWP2_9BILA|nr:hypothetical protein T10_8520 [Trichinella papuae]